MAQRLRWLRAALSAAVLLPVWAAAVVAQEPGAARITGRVTDENGVGLPAATVAIPELGVGATAGADGAYVINIPAARVQNQQVTLTARAIGYRASSQQITLGQGPATQEFALAANPLQLGEIVVTGAGTVSEVEKLGTVRSNVDSTEITRSHEQNVVNALAAKAPNVTVISSSGDPGASSFVQVRGLTTISASDGQPLFVVDGVPIDNSIQYNTGNGQLALNNSAAPPNRALDINPDDIAGVEILKGAASGAIYGSRAGQGVILITTKKGSAGPTRYSLRSSFSVDNHSRVPDFQTKYGLGSAGAPPSCVEGGALNCRVPLGEAGSWGPELAADQPRFDHSDDVFQTGYLTDNTLTVSGGSDRTTFYLSGGYSRNRGTVVGDNNYYQRISVRFNGTHRVFDNLKLGANVAYVDGDGGFLVTRNSTEGLLLGAWRSPANFDNRNYLDPEFGLHRSYRFPNPAPGSETLSRSYDNPFFAANEYTARSAVGRTYGGVNGEFNALSWLRFNYTLGLDYSNDERTQGWPLTSSSGNTSFNGVGGVFGGYIRTSQIDHNLTATASHTFSPSLGGSITVGQNLNSNTYQTRQVVGSTLIAPQPFNLTNTVTQLPPLDYRQTVRLESYFAQATADLYDQIFLTAALRNDGASSFGANDRRNWFPKASAAWVFVRGNEQGGRGTLSYAKLRTAYGESGTQPSPYLLSSLFNSTTFADGGWGPTSSTQLGGSGGLVTRYNLPTSDLGPERVKEFEVGTDLGLFRDKADLSLTYYRQHSSDVILNIPVAGTTGYTEKPANAAKLRNIGVELALNVRPITARDFGWDFGVQWARNRSLVTDLAGVVFAPFPLSGGSNGLGVQGVAIEGQRIGVIYGSDFVRCGRGLIVGGVDLDNTAGECQGAPSGALYIDGSGYAQLDADNNYIVGDPNPDWTGSLRSSLRFKKFSVTGLLDIRHGGQAYNGTKAALDHFGTSKRSQEFRDGGQFVFGQNYLAGQQAAGPGAGTPVALDELWFTGAGGVFNGPVSLFLEDGGFTKLREVSVGYTLDSPWVSRTLGFSSIDFRVAGRNLLTWTNYTGVDPETSLLGSATAVRGIDYFNNPQTRSFVFSLTLSR